MKHLFFLSFFLISASYAEVNISALLEKANSVKSQDTVEFNRLLADLEQHSSDFTSYEANFYRYLQAYSIGFSGETTHAIQYFREVYQSTNNIDLKVRALTSIINMYGINRNYVEGYSEAQQLMELVKKASKKMQIHAYAGLSIFYNQLDEFKLGLLAANKVIEASDDPRVMCIAHSTKMEAEYHLRLALAPSSVDKAIDLCQNVDENVAVLLNLVIKAKLHAQLEELDIAISLLESKADIFRSVTYPVAKADYESALAQFYFKAGDFERAKAKAQSAIELSSGAGLFRPRIAAFEVLYKYYENKGNVELSHQFYKAYAETEKAFLDETKITQLAIRQTQYDALEKANQIELLNKENSLLKTQAELAQREIDNSRLIIATLVLLACIILVWLLINRKMQLQLRNLAQTDKLTGVANRHYFTQLAEKALSYHKKTDQHLTIVVFDLDLFKNVNDSYGHTVGDWTLKAVVDVVKRVCRAQDVVGRLGGEEFAIVLPGCAARKAESITESCRRAIAGIDTSPTGVRFTVTASFGIADTRHCGYKYQSLYANADRALYRSKNEGRNRIYVSDGYPDEVFTMDGQLT